MTERDAADAGPGVPPALRDRVFERFVQGDAGPCDSRGLGLAFCKLAIEAQGGSIWIETPTRARSSASGSGPWRSPVLLLTIRIYMHQPDKVAKV